MASAHIQRPVVTIRQAQDICHVSRRTVYNWIAGRKVEFVRTPSGSVRIFADCLLKSSRALEAES